MGNARRLTFAHIFLAASWLFPDVLAAGDMNETRSWGSCSLALQNTHFSDIGPNATELEKICQSRLRHLSLYLCLKTYGQNGDWTDELAAQNDTCQTYVHASLPPFTIVANYTDSDISRLRQVTLQDWSDGVTFDREVLVSDDLNGIAYDTLVSDVADPFWGLATVLRL